VAGSPGSGFAGPRAGSEARLVVIEAELRHPGLARVLESAEIGGPRVPVFVIGVDGEGVARPVGDGGDGPALVGDQPAPVGEARALVTQTSGSSVPAPVIGERTPWAARSTRERVRQNQPSAGSGH
jgi:hypothetical protein